MVEEKNSVQHGIVYLMLTKYLDVNHPQPDACMNVFMAYYWHQYTVSQTKRGRSELRRTLNIEEIPFLNEPQIAESLYVLEEKGIVKSYMSDPIYHEGTGIISSVRRFHPFGDLELNEKMFKSFVNPNTMAVLKALADNNNHPMSHSELYFNIEWNGFMDAAEEMLEQDSLTIN